MFSDFKKMGLLNEGNTRNNKTNTNNFEFTSIDDMIITEVILDHFQFELNRLKKGITNFKSNCRLFVENGHYAQLYSEKKKLISDFIKCVEKREKEGLKQKLVS